MINYIYILVAIIYTTTLPGFVFVELVYSNAESWKKIPLYLLFSVLISTYTTYLTSLFFGFNKTVVISDFLIFLFFLPIVVKKYKYDFPTIKKHALSLLIAVFVYLVFFIPLNQGIFKRYFDSYVMSGPNWQDTAMHLSIIESVSQGNFPPQAPYFSGQPLSYYYFADMHASIISLMSGRFFPEVLIILNPFLAMLFYLSVYFLTFSIIKNKKFSILSGFLAIFYGNLGFINLLIELVSKKLNYFDVITNNPYHLNFEGTIQMVPMADYFLQNRPMMVGLPSIVIVVTLLLYKLDRIESDRSVVEVLLAGLIVAGLVKFQFFGFIVGLMIFGLLMLYKIFIKKNKIVNILKEVLFFVAPSIVMLLVFGAGKAGDRPIYQVVWDSFAWGAWEKHKISWYLNFIISNLNIIFLLFLSSIFFLRKLKSSKINFIYIIAFITFLIPFVLKFTIYDYDMFKFFYYCVPFVCVVFAIFSKYIYKRNKLYLILVLIVLITTVWTSTNVLIHSYLNKSVGYSVADEKVGQWVRNNIPQKSVFITLPSVHSPISDIGGRLRIISYINWPYSHGFNVGVDNVFSRDEDIKTFYDNIDNEEITLFILNKYKIDYVYFGPDESSDFPAAENKLESNSLFKKIYDQEGIKIYQRIK